jgi:hypothetical protein
MHPGLIELFVAADENGLPDAGRLDMLGLGNGSVVFLLQRLGGALCCASALAAFAAVR